MPPQYTGSFPIEADYAISSSYSSTSSFLLGHITSASYADLAATASYLLGSIASAISASWAVLSGHSLTSDTASYAFYAVTASYVMGSSITSSYAIHAGSADTASYGIFPQVIVSGSDGSVGYMFTSLVSGISTATAIDSFDATLGNSAEWLVSVNDGQSYKTSKVLAIWNSPTGSTNWTEVTTNAIGPGTSYYSLLVTLAGSHVNLYLNPASGSWNAKTIRFIV